MRFSSAACLTCKARHVKCDERAPVCARCEKARVACRRADAVFHIENGYASRERKRPRGPRSRASPSGDVNVVRFSMQDRQTRVGDDTEMVQQGPRCAPTDLDSTALAYFLRFHIADVERAPAVIQGHCDGFLGIWQAGRSEPLLHLSVSAMALAVFSQVQRRPGATVAALGMYQRLLEFVRARVAAPHGQELEVCLLASFFMGRFEDALHEADSYEDAVFVSGLQSRLHHDGTLDLLRMWKDEGGKVSAVVKHSRRGAVKSCLMRGRELPEWILDGALFGEGGAELQFDRIVIRIVLARQRLLELQSMKHTCGIESLAANLAAEAAAIDGVLCEWVDHFPAGWNVETHKVPRTTALGLLSPVVYIYPSQAIAGVWNHYYAMRMLANSVRLRVLNTMSSASLEFSIPGQHGSCLSNIESMANSLAASLPFCYGHVFESNGSVHISPGEGMDPYAANLTVWPLTIASGLKDLDPERRLWFRSQIAKVGRAVGSKVLQCAESEPWIEL